jgi:hypothetical protein
MRPVMKFYHEHLQFVHLPVVGTDQKNSTDTSGEVRTHALKEDQNLSLAP